MDQPVDRQQRLCAYACGGSSGADIDACVDTGAYAYVYVYVYVYVCVCVASASASTEAEAEAEAVLAEGIRPIEWAPSETEEHAAGAAGDEQGGEGIPDWLLALRQQAAPPQAGAVAGPEAVAVAVAGAVVLQPLEWKPAESAAAGNPPSDSQPADAAPPATSDETAQLPAVAEPTAAAVAPPAAPAAAGGRATRPRKTKSKPSKHKPKPAEQLASARRSVAAADYAGAADIYARLVRSGKHLDQVAADLDVATHAYPDLPQFHRLLGEVRAREGDIQAALAAYRRAMELQHEKRNP